MTTILFVLSMNLINELNEDILIIKKIMQCGTVDLKDLLRLMNLMIVKD